MTAERRLASCWRELEKSIRAFLLDADSGTAKVHWPDFRMVALDDRLNARLAQPVVLHGWPLRGGSHRNWKLVIAIEAELEIDRNDPVELCGYGTQVSYFYVRPDNLRALHRLHGYHYDMDIRGLCGHPVFHAQPFQGIDLNRLRTIRAFEDFVINEQDSQTRIVQNIRIPTAQLDVVSVFLMLIADHFLKDGDEISDAAFRDFMRLSSITRSPLFARSAPGLEQFIFDIGNGGVDLRSCHWYAQQE